jgi:hypothetical protein
MEDQAQPRGEDGVADDALQRAEAASHLDDLVERTDALRRGQGRPLGLLDQPVERGDLVETGSSQRRGQLERRRLAATHRHHHERREGADPSRTGAVGPGHPGQPLLDRVDRLAGGVHRRSELDHEGLELAQVPDRAFLHVSRTGCRRRPRACSPRTRP